MQSNQAELEAAADAAEKAIKKAAAEAEAKSLARAETAAAAAAAAAADDSDDDNNAVEVSLGTTWTNTRCQHVSVNMCSSALLLNTIADQSLELNIIYRLCMPGR
jgi:hypothetical protein